MHTPRPSHPAHGTAKKPSTGDRKQKFDSNCNFFAIGNCCEPSDRRSRYKTAGNPPFSGRFRFARLKNEPLIAKKLQKERDFCFHNGQIATTGTKPCEKRVKSPSKGKRAYPPQKKQEGKTTRANQINRADSAKAQGPSNGGRAEPEKLTRVPARARGTPQKDTRPPATVAGQISRRRATKQGGSARQKMGVAIQIWGARKKVRRGFGGPFQERIRYASEGSHSTMQLFKNGLESGASALTIRNLASPSAVFQTSVRKRTPGRTGEVKRHLKRVIASG